MSLNKPEAYKAVDVTLQNIVNEIIYSERGGHFQLPKDTTITDLARELRKVFNGKASFKYTPTYPLGVPKHKRGNPTGVRVEMISE